jgi:phospholipase C
MNASTTVFASTPITRRRLFDSAAGLAAAAATTLMPPNLRRALAAPQPAGSLREIKHVVLLMQENRSFDHYFGTLAGVRGFGDENALKLPNGKSVFYQPDPLNPNGYLLPFHLDTHTTSAQKIPSTSHAWSVQHASWNFGKMNNWLLAHRVAEGEKAPYVMGYHTRADIPFHFALAEAFTICDAYHCSVMGPTWPNRMYWMTGTIDADGQFGGPIISNDAAKGGFRWTTYPERLEKAGVSWKIYQEKDNFGCNMLEHFTTFQHADHNSGVYKRGIVWQPAGTFEHDAMNDKLPAVSWIIPTSAECEHPDSIPAAGEAYVARKLNAIAANPDVWAKTVFILNYDENDGIFDHVPPPVPPEGTPQEFVHKLPIGGGFRVPCIIVSPWTAGGWVCSQPFDHTSCLQLLEKVTGVREPNISEWRRKTFGDLTSAFRFEESKANAPKLPDAEKPLAEVHAKLKKLPKPTLPGKYQKTPVQESGKRKRLPTRQV